MKASTIVVILMFLISACQDGKKGVANQATGKVNEILVVASKNVWDGPVGDSIRAYFQQEQDGLPQAEPLFDLLNLPEKHFVKNIRGHRNVLQIVVSSEADSAMIQFINEPWTKTQKMVRITVRNTKQFNEIFDANKAKILALYVKAEKDRLVSAYTRTADAKIFNLFKNKYKLLLYCPTGFYVNKDTAGFVWISSETQMDSRGICFFTEPYRSEKQFDSTAIVKRVNEELERFIPGPLDGTKREQKDGTEEIVRSYMQIDTEVPFTMTHYRYNGHYALYFRGLWTVTRDFMAGPFVMNVVLDEENNRVIYMLGYVYYPNEKKRNMVKQLEAIMSTMKIDLQDKEAKNKKDK